MPFDSTNFVETSPHVEEIAILDKMAEILATPERWCKRHMFRKYACGQVISVCVVGALRFSVGGEEALENWVKTPEARSVWDRLNEVGGNEIAAINDASGTTHQDILDLIAKTRASFS